jgi:hypothetical protein
MISERYKFVNLLIPQALSGYLTFSCPNNDVEYVTFKYKSYHEYELRNAFEIDIEKKDGDTYKGQQIDKAEAFLKKPVITAYYIKKYGGGELVVYDDLTAHFIVYGCGVPIVCFAYGKLEKETTSCVNDK